MWNVTHFLVTSPFTFFTYKEKKPYWLVWFVLNAILSFEEHFYRYFRQIPLETHQFVFFEEMQA